MTMTRTAALTLAEHSLHTRHRAEPITSMIYFPEHLMNKVLYNPHFTEKKAETQGNVLLM